MPTLAEQHIEHELRGQLSISLDRLYEGLEAFRRRLSVLPKETREALNVYLIQNDPEEMSLTAMELQLKSLSSAILYFDYDPRRP